MIDGLVVALKSQPSLPLSLILQRPTRERGLTLIISVGSAFTLGHQAIPLYFSAATVGRGLSFGRPAFSLSHFPPSNRRRRLRPRVPRRPILATLYAHA